MSKNVNNNKLTLSKKESALKRLKILGSVGIVFSIGFIIYDIIDFSNWLSIISIIGDVFLLVLSIFFIVKSVQLGSMDNKTSKKTAKNKKISK